MHTEPRTEPRFYDLVIYTIVPSSLTVTLRFNTRLSVRQYVTPRELLATGELAGGGGQHCRQRQVPHQLPGHRRARDN